MASLNMVTLIGNLGNDPEVRKTQNGLDVTNFSLATKEIFTKDGQRTEQTEWHKIVVWGKSAENCAKFLKKGSPACVQGKIQTRKYEKDGIAHYSTEIVASNVQFLSGKSNAKEEQISPKQEPAVKLEYDFEDVPF